MVSRKRIKQFNAEAAKARDGAVLDSTGMVMSQRPAIDEVLGKAVTRKSSPGKIKSIAAQLNGVLPGKVLAEFTTIEELESPAEAKQLMARLREVPALLDAVAVSLVEQASRMLLKKSVRERARPFFDLLLELAPKKRSKPNPRVYNRWLGALNDAINSALRAKELALAEQLADLARPHARANELIPHNAACAFVAAGRDDDAMEMCRAAVEVGYEHIDLLVADRDLKRLRTRSDFKALFADA